MSVERVARALMDTRFEVLGFVARGLVSKEIALEMGISEKAVNYRIYRCCRMLGASTRAEAVAVAVKRGLI